MRILGIDPGTAKSAAVLFDGERVGRGFHVENQDVLRNLESTHYDLVAIERIRCYGPNVFVGNETLETCEWAGQFFHAAVSPVWITRKEAVIHLTGNTRAKDPQVRGCLIDRFGGKAAAIGTKKNPGPLYGVSGHCWAALAIAVTAYDQESAKVSK